MSSSGGGQCREDAVYNELVVVLYSSSGIWTLPVTIDISADGSSTIVPVEITSCGVYLRLADDSMFFELKKLECFVMLLGITISILPETMRIANAFYTPPYIYMATMRITVACASTLAHFSQFQVLVPLAQSCEYLIIRSMACVSLILLCEKTCASRACGYWSG